MPIEDLPPDVQPIAQNLNRSPAEQEKLEAAYKARYGEGSSELEPQVETELDDDLKSIKARYEGGDDVDPEAEREAIAKENHQIETSLREDPDWADYDSALRGSMDYARELVDGDDELANAIAGVINEKRGPAGQIKIMKQLWKLARGRQ